MLTRIKKADAKKQIVYGEVYAPNIIDAHGDIMTAEDVEILAHRFLQLPVLKGSVDTFHSHNPVAAYPVESFIARPGDPDYAEGAWVLAVKVEDKEIWDKIETGEINGFSIDAYAVKQDVQVTAAVFKSFMGETKESEGHTHFLFATLNESGKVIGGMTDTVNGHFHEIRRASVTETSNNHSHRFSLE